MERGNRAAVRDGPETPPATGPQGPGVESGPAPTAGGGGGSTTPRDHRDPPPEWKPGEWHTEFTEDGGAHTWDENGNHTYYPGDEPGRAYHDDGTVSTKRHYEESRREGLAYRDEWERVRTDELPAPGGGTRTVEDIGLRGERLDAMKTDGPMPYTGRKIVDPHGDWHQQTERWFDDGTVEQVRQNGPQRQGVRSGRGGNEYLTPKEGATDLMRDDAWEWVPEHQLPDGFERPEMGASLAGRNLADIVPLGTPE